MLGATVFVAAILYPWLTDSISNKQFSVEAVGPSPTSGVSAEVDIVTSDDYDWANPEWESELQIIQSRIDSIASQLDAASSESSQPINSDRPLQPAKSEN